MTPGFLKQLIPTTCLLAILLIPATSGVDPYVAPTSPVIPYPAEGARGISLFGDTLKWNASSSAKSYDVYLSQDSSAVAKGDGSSSNAWKENTEETKLATGKHQVGTSYFWRIDAVDEQGNKTKGKVHKYTATKSKFVTRLNGGKPIIDFSFPGIKKPGVGPSLNGPSLIRIPDWIPPEKRADPSAVYYLYFAHHGGQHIRMAWSKHIEGPYTMYQPGTGVALKKVYSPFLSMHIASPDVHVDHETQTIHMYVHGRTSGFDESQSSVVLVSKWGLDYKLPTTMEARSYYTPPGRKEKDLDPMDAVLGAGYFRVFSYQGYLHAIGNFGPTYKARDKDDPWNADLNGDGEKDVKKKEYLWETGVRLIEPEHKNKTWRHIAVRVRGDTLDVWFTTRAASPERIRLAKIDLSVEGGHKNWTFEPPVDVLEPELLWEGGDLPITKSKNSGAKGVRQLRDPGYFKDIDGKEYLLYAGRGEEAIGIAIFNEYLEEKPTSVKKIEKLDLKKVELQSRNGSWELSGESNPVSVKLHDVSGKLIRQFENNGEGALAISTKGFQSGMYLLSAQFKSGQTKTFRQIVP